MPTKKNKTEHVTRYAITHLDRDGVRQITFGSSARNTYPTEVEATQHLRAVTGNNSANTLRQVYGPHVLDTFKVMPVNCYPSGDVAETNDLCKFFPVELQGGGAGVMDLATLAIDKRYPAKTLAEAVAWCLKLNA